LASGLRGSFGDPVLGRPLLIAFAISFLMLTWRKGEEVMDAVRLEIRQPSKEFIDELRRDPPRRITLGRGRRPSARA
jgi:hypothetical protein